MLFYLSLLQNHISELRLFKYVTVRTLGAAATAFIISLLLAPWLIRKLRIINFGEQREDERVAGLDRSRKVGTPTMGGLLIILAASLSALLWAIPTNKYVLITLGTFILMGAIGFADDYLKIKRRNGLSVNTKFTAQLLWTGIIFAVLWSMP
ncbi:MAG TPA: hypothetical protein VLL07_06280, partial [Pontiella sp.]|nr:hypothetical protein [Pontiella sp.]